MHIHQGQLRKLLVIRTEIESIGSQILTIINMQIKLINVIFLIKIYQTATKTEKHKSNFQISFKTPREKRIENGG